MLLTIGVFADKVGELTYLGRPNTIIVEGNSIFVVDRYSVHSFELDTLKENFVFGRKGQGPGEFTTMPYINVTRDYVLATCRDRAIWISKDGKMIKEKRILKIYKIRPVKENFTGITLNPGDSSKTVWLLNPQFEKITPLYTTRLNLRRTLHHSSSTEFEITDTYFDWQCCDDKIFVGNNEKGFVIAVFNSDGKFLYEIKKEIERVKVTKEYKNRALEELKIVSPLFYESKTKGSFTFLNYHYNYKSFRVDNDKIYVLTYKMKGEKHEIIILDSKGNILKRVFVPFQSFRYYRWGRAPWTVHKDILYEMIDSEISESWELHKIDFSKF
jgi:hypothetical protein